MTDLNERIARLSPEKRALLEMYLMKKNTGIPKDQGIPRRGTSDPCPLSFAQQRLWFLDQLEPNSPLYNISKAVRMTGKLNLSAMQTALNAIVERHESLRTIFNSVDGIPMQIIKKDFSMALQMINLDTLPSAEREEKAQLMINEEMRRPFDLSKDLMLRATLLKLNTEEHILILVIHHIASDGWSMGILFRELADLYEAFINGQPSPLPDLPIQYSDFAVWQKDWFKGEVAKNQLSYWKERLVEPSTLELPTDKVRPAVQTFKGEKLLMNLSRELTESLISLSRKNSSTLFMTLLSAFDVLLYRYTGQEDIVIGSPIANRNRIELEELIGFFVNTLVMRTDLSGNPTFRELLGRVREIALGAYANQDLPFEKLVDEIHPERDLSRTPVFQVVFVLQNTPKSKFELSGLTMDSIKLEDGMAKFDLTLSITETDKGLNCQWEYNSDLFDSATIARMSEHFNNLLEAIVADPDQQISQLPILSEAEKHQLLVEWNDTKEEYPRDKCIHQLFETQVERIPDAVAVEFEGKQLTYQELNARSNQLANYLQKLGVKPETLIGLCMEKSLEMIIGIMGILKAGGAYIPISPDYPIERLAFIMEDTKATILLTQSANSQKLSADSLPLITICYLDEDWGVISKESDKNPHVSITPENLVYVIYTSGSTGKPKGVMIQHDSLVNFVTGANAKFQFHTGDRVLQFASISFDGAALEIFPCLLNGASLILRTGTMLDSIAGFLQECESLKLTAMFLPTAYWHELVSSIESLLNEDTKIASSLDKDTKITPPLDKDIKITPPLDKDPKITPPLDKDPKITPPLNKDPKIIPPLDKDPKIIPPLNKGGKGGSIALPSSLRLVIIGGEKALRDRLMKWMRLPSKSIELINAYGPTEGTIAVTMCKLTDNMASRITGEVPIGRPLSNVQLYVLDTYKQPVPVGVYGELYAGGDCLARGYLNRPELTAEYFIPNPYSGSPLTPLNKGDKINPPLNKGGEGGSITNGRLYKTGDLVRYMPDGNLEFIDRVDNQVKVRGFRIELGEIEVVLRKHPDIREAVVIAREDVPGDRRLVAYIVPGNKQMPEVSELRTFLKEKLPDYMVPGAFIMMDALPMTSSGKVNRKVLPVPDKSQIMVSVASHDDSAEPRNDSERILASIWAEVLRLEKVGIHDNFFELGGDSILSIQIIARANNAGFRLTPKQIFQYQTIAELALVVDTANIVQAEQGIVTGSVLLTPIQRWFFEQNLTNVQHYNMSFLLDVSPDTDADALKKAIKELLIHHDALRMRFVKNESGWVQNNIAPDEKITFMMVDISGLPLDEQSSKITSVTSELQSSLNISEGPLMRVAFFKSDEGMSRRLLLIIHHLVVDGISWRILLDDLCTAYQQVVRGEVIQLPHKTTSFKDWSQKLYEYAQTEALSNDIQYWLSQSRDQLSSLPLDYVPAKGPNSSSSTVSMSVSLSVDETRMLLQDVPKYYNTQINDVLLTALLHTFAAWTGKNTLLVDLEGHGREELLNDVDFTRTVGWFTSVFPVLLKRSGDSQPYETLKSVAENLYNIPNRGVGYGILRYLRQESSVNSKLKSFPQAEVGFNYLGQYDQILKKPPLLKITRESAGSNRSTKDLRRHFLEVVAIVVENMLQVEWVYSENLHQRKTIEILAQGFIEALKSIISHSMTSSDKRYRPSDFPDVELSQEKLDNILEQLDLDD